jgi:hypothetical protein
MKKRVLKVKKFQLSRETLRNLENSDAQKVLGGNQGGSTQSQHPDEECCRPTNSSSFC